MEREEKKKNFFSPTLWRDVEEEDWAACSVERGVHFAPDRHWPILRTPGHLVIFNELTNQG